jgi:microcystin degradation protein MlrC
MKRRPRVGITGLWHETNTYSARKTTLAQFEEFELAEGQAVAELNRGTGSVIGGFCDADDFDLVPIFSAGAWPGGLISAQTIEEIFGRIGQGLASAGELDGMLVNLHGAMVAEDCADVDTALLQLIRERAAGIPIAAVVDLHANLAPEIVDVCDVLISYDTYPHVDMRERGREAASQLAAVLGGRALHTRIAKIPILACPLAQATAQDPMQGLQRRAAGRAQANELDRICIVGGFAYSDVERAGMSVLVVADDAHADSAQSVLEETAADVREHGADFRVVRPGPRESVAAALQAKSKPVVLADVGDNIGGGSAGDGTALLAELLRQGARDAVVLLADAEVATRAAGLGEGASLDANVGGKTDRMHGSPVHIKGRVRRITDGSYVSHGTWMTGHRFSMGTTAVIELDGVSLVVMERPTPPFHAEQLLSVGIDPRAAGIIAVKGAIAWRAAYGDIAGTVIEVDTPGVCPVDPSVLPRLQSPQRT